MMQTLRVEKLLPLEHSALGAHEKGAPPASSSEAVDYIYEQPTAEIFNKLIPRYVEMQIYRMIAESSAAEHAARMTAMESATSNASDVIDALTLHMNKVRQAAITREIIEVVSGAASAG
jgi:F-type H+-transporting ATPase subunit gamma